MTIAHTAALKPPIQKFLFSEHSTIGHLLATVNELEKSGRPPFLKFVGHRGQITALEVLVQEEPKGAFALEEMAVAGCDDLPDPAFDVRLRAMLDDVRWNQVTDDTPVLFGGKWTTWGELGGGERMLCAFDDDGVLVGSMPF